MYDAWYNTTVPLFLFHGKTAPISFCFVWLFGRNLPFLFYFVFIFILYFFAFSQPFPCASYRATKKEILRRRHTTQSHYFVCLRTQGRRASGRRRDRRDLWGLAIAGILGVSHPWTGFFCRDFDFDIRGDYRRARNYGAGSPGRAGARGQDRSVRAEAAARFWPIPRSPRHSHHRHCYRRDHWRSPHGRCNRRSLHGGASDERGRSASFHAGVLCLGDTYRAFATAARPAATGHPIDHAAAATASAS